VHHYGLGKGVVWRRGVYEALLHPFHASQGLEHRLGAPMAAAAEADLVVQPRSGSWTAFSVRLIWFVTRLGDE